MYGWFRFTRTVETLICLPACRTFSHPHPQHHLCPVLPSSSLAIFHSVSPFHTSHPGVLDTCLTNASDSVSVTLPQSSAQVNSLTWNNVTLSPLLASSPPCAAPVFSPLTPPPHGDTRRRQSAAALGGSVFCSSVKSPSQFAVLSCLFVPLILRQTHYQRGTAACVRQRWLAPFHSIIVKRRRTDIWQMEIRQRLIPPATPAETVALR